MTKLLRQCIATMTMMASTCLASNNVTLDLQDANLADALRIIAKFTKTNVVISKTIQGTANIHLQDAKPTQAFDLVLATHGLAKWQMGNIWFVAPRDELIKQKQADVKWQTLWDESQPLETITWQIHYGKAEDIAKIIQSDHESFLSKRGHVRIDARINMLCIQDIPERIAAIRKLIRALDVPTKQIMIEARLASVDKDYEQELGIDFSVKDQAGKAAISDTLNPLRGQKGRYSIAIASLPDGSLLDVKLLALENQGHAELISSPSLFAANQQAASIEAGEEVPYQEVSESGGTAIVFKKAVLGLKVTPQLLPGNRILLQLQINQDRPGGRMVLGMPTINTRQIKTSVLVNAGQTIVLGGIYETNSENAEQSVPFISKVPLIGELFKQRISRKMKRELLIFVTPKVVT